jgi:hypothetical protein
MPTASARGALVTDCQYVAISGLWVQCQQATALKNRARRRQKIEKDAASPAILVTEVGGYTLVP